MKSIHFLCCIKTSEYLRFNKKYASQKLHDYRRQVFAANLVRIAAAQNKAKTQNNNVKYGINSLADETPEEFAAVRKIHT